MPNWCQNTFEVFGPNEDVRRFTYDIHSGEGRGYAGPTLSFERHLPTPPEMLEPTGSATGLPEWYNWRVLNWGTKWDASEVEKVLDQPDYVAGMALVTYSFVTAWSPPLEWLKRVLVQYPTLAAKLCYREEGMGFEGYMAIYNGQVVDEDEWEYRSYPGPEVDELAGLFET